ncbi:MAG: TlpA family protein disulfide reductase [Paramuribaculum sp.]|nr:TlpA family protein disulfide reductase [Paramuribaculum sp.]MDE6304863.1 TlpA family protein disulfide reductase [Paramuribaculum sp.]
MFKKLLTSLTVASILTVSGVSVNAKIIKNPSFDARTSSILTVEEIDLGKKETRMKFRAVFRPTWWFSVDSTEYILDPATGEKFYPTAIEGIKFGERVTMPQSADTVFTIIYPPLPKNTKTLDLFPESYWKTFGLSLSDKKSTIKNTPDLAPVAGQRIPTPSFFTEGNMHLYGRIKGYDPRLGFSAMKLYIDDIVTGKNMAKMIPLDSCGRFDYQIFTHNPQTVSISIDSKAHLPLYIEAGNDLQVIIDMEDILDIDRMRGLKFFLENVEYGGSLAEINRAFLKAPEKTGPTAHALADDTAPLEAKEIISRSIADYRERMEKYIGENDFTPHTRDYLLNSILAKDAEEMFDYDMYRKLNRDYYPDSTFFSTPTPPEYFAEIAPAILTADTTVLAASSAHFLLNRLAYSTLPQAIGVKGRYVTDRPETAKAIAEYCNSTEVPFIWQITVSAAKGPGIDGTARRMKDYYRQELDNLYANVISSPYLRMRLDNHFEQQVNAKSYELPATPAGNLMRKLIEPYSGKWILVDFWATTCGPCRGNIEQMKAFRDANRDSDQFTFLFITSEDQSPLKAYNSYVEKNLANDHSLYLTPDEILLLQDLFEINGIPHYVLITPEGLVYDKKISHHDFFTVLDHEGIPFNSVSASANNIIIVKNDE